MVDRGGCPVCPGVHRLRPRRSGPPSCRWGSRCRSDGCGEFAEPLPAGEERVFPGPVRADLEDLLAGVADEAGGKVPDPVAERVGLGVLEVFLVVEAQEPGPGGEVGGDVGGRHPAAVDLPGSRSCGF